MSLDVILVLFQLVVLFFSFSVHESVHAWAALRLGDPTAYMLGRVTMNPARQLDPWGSFVMPLISLVFGGALIGWGKPVPITLRNFKRIRRDDIVSTLAGLASHLALAVVALLLLLALKHAHGAGTLSVQAAMLMVNHVPIDMNLLPRLFPLALLLYYFVVTNILLFVFNLIPVPPLDGARILRNFLPYRWEQTFDRIGILGSLAIFFVAGRILFPLLFGPLVNVCNGLLLSL
jgi:Zn-dependent protease